MLPDLASLDLFETKLYGSDFCLPYIFELLRNRHARITNLCISDSYVKRIPAGIQHLARLSVLDLSHCTSLVALPASLGACQSLREIDLCNTSVEALPEDIGDLYQLRSLDISSCAGLKCLPKSISRLQSLTVLKAHDCAAVAYSLNLIGPLTKLRRLDVSRSCVRYIPDAIGGLQQLTQLLIGSNSLVEFPMCVTRLTNLRILGLNNCNIRSLPKELANLLQLRALDLSFNWLARLPEFLSCLTKMETLYLADCGLSELPLFITQFSNLTAVDVSLNDITSLPEGIFLLDQLRYFFHVGNGIGFNPVARQYMHALDSFVARLPHITYTKPLPFPGFE
jgi:Leucine-rich repeat (LRR) protein